MAVKRPADLGPRGARLWREMTGSGSLTPAHLVLLEEACRLADRLDWLNAILLRWTSQVNGGDEEDEPKPAEITGLLAESRQQATTLRGLVAEIRQSQKGAVAPSSKSAGKAGGSGVSDLTARIAARKRQAPG